MSEIRVQVRCFKDFKYLDIRVWVDADDGNERRPTTKGITCQLERAQELRAALKLVLDKMPPEERPGLGI